MTCAPSNEISPAALAAFDRIRARLAAFDRIRARLAVDEIEALCCEVSIQLLEIEALRAWGGAATVAALAGVFAWWPSGGSVPS